MADIVVDQLEELPAQLRPSVQAEGGKIVLTLSVSAIETKVVLDLDSARFLARLLPAALAMAEIALRELANQRR